MKNPIIPQPFAVWKPSFAKGGRSSLWMGAALGLALWLLPSATLMGQASLGNGATMEVLGVGTASLLGGDLTDPEDDGDESLGASDLSWNWVSIDSDDEPGFEGGEFAFNVFDNVLAAGNGKWCCTDATEASPRHITVEFFDVVRLTHFTVSSANDVPARDPQDWKIQGSNDGTTFTDIFVQSDDVTHWGTVRFQVNKYTLNPPAPAYKFIRYQATRTADALHQLGEIEYFGELGPGVPVITLLGTGTAALLGGDLTDPDNNGNEGAGPADPSWNWDSITSNNEPGFGGGEFSFNIFDNVVGGGAAKWCCDDPSPANPLWVDVKFRNPVLLKHFTITSGNDARDREPLKWKIKGSNNGVAYTDIFVQDSATSIWTASDQVAKVTLPAAAPPYLHLRYEVTDTAGPLHQLNEIEYFGDVGGVSKPTLTGRKVETNNVQFEITDGADSTLNGGSVVVKIDGATVATVMSKVGAVTSFTHTPAVPFVPHSVHPYEITGVDSFGNALKFTGDFTQPGISNIIGGGKWVTEHVWTNSAPQISDVGGAEAALDDPVTIAAESIIVNTTYIHFDDNAGPPLHAAESQPYPLWDPVNGGTGRGDRNDFAIRCREKINIIRAGNCWFVCNSDDGFSLRIDGTEIGSAGNRGRGNTAMSADLTAGPHDVEFIHWERGGGAGVSVYIYKGLSDTEPPFGQDWELLQAWLNPNDSDGDGMPDVYELANELNPAVNDAALDKDGDTLNNLAEFQRGTRANKADTDDDGLTDKVETNTGTFVNATNTGTNPLVADTDGDGLRDGPETNTGTFVSATNTGTNPFNKDTDGDGLVDGAEVTLGSSPLSAASLATVIQGGGKFTTEHVWTRSNPQLTGGGAEAVLDDPSVFPPADSITVPTTYIHFHDDVAPPWFVPESKPYPLWDQANGGTGFGTREDFAIRSRGKVMITKPGMVWFNCNSDDGFFLRVDGTEIGTAPDRGRADTVMSADLAVGLHDVELVHWERGGGAGVSVLVYRAITATAPPVSGNTWQLLEAFPAQPASTIAITNFTYNPGTSVVNLTFASAVGSNYALEYTTGFLPAGAPASPTKWTVVPSHASIAGAAGTTSIAPLNINGLGLANNSQVYLRVRKL